MALTLRVPGYERLVLPGIRGVGLSACSAFLLDVLKDTSLYEYAQGRPEVRKFEGRAPVYAIDIPGCGPVVVKHAMRGGWAARLSTDKFLPPTRGLRELINSVRLRAARIPTPELVAFVTYRAGPILRRCDIVTREIAHAYDLAEVFSRSLPESERREALSAVAELLIEMTRAGAHHPDLNLRNILLTRETESGGLLAHLIDVDRVRFNSPQSPMITDANLERLTRSLEKREAAGTIVLDRGDIAWLRARARGQGS